MNTKPISLLLLLLLIFKFNPSFSQTENDGGDYEDGRSCETAYTYELSQETEYSFQEEQDIIYVSFTANDDSLDILILEGDQLVSSYFTMVEIYEIESCNNMSLIHSQTPDEQNMLSFIRLTALEEESQYLFIGHKQESLNEQTSFKFYSQSSLIAPCNIPPLTCDEMIENGDFTYVAWTPAYTHHSFRQNHVCSWDFVGGTPDLIFRENGLLNNGALLSDSYAGLYTDYQAFFGKWTESISTPINVQKNELYYISFTLESEKFQPPDFLDIPDEFNVFLANQVDLDQIQYPREFLHNFSMKQDITLLSRNQISPSLTTYYYCFKADEDFDRLVFHAIDTDSLGKSYIHLDKVSLRKYALNMNNSYTIQDCENSVQIGPDCVYPGATYSWTPTNGLSKPNIPNPIAYPSKTTNYTLNISMPGSTTCLISDQLTVNVSNPVDYIIPDGTNVAQINSMTGLQNVVRGKTLKIEGELIVDQDFGFVNCNLYMAEDAKITILNNASFTIGSGMNDTTPNFIKTCNPNQYWDGIYKTGDGSFSFWGDPKVGGVTQPYDRNDILHVKNSKNGLVFNEVSNIYMSAVYFENNGKVITVENNEKDLTASMHGLFMECTSPLDFLGYDFYPAYSVKFKDVSRGTDPNFGNGTRFGGNFRGYSFSSPSTYIDGSAGSVIVENSEGINIKHVEFAGFNNEYFTNGGPEKQTTALKVTGSLRYPTVTLRDNYFLNNELGAHFIGNVKTRVGYNRVNKDHNNVVFNGLKNSTFLKVNDNLMKFPIGGGVAPYDNLHYIWGNQVFNVKRGMEFYNALYYYVFDNTFDLEVQASSNNYIDKDNSESIAIYVNGYNDQFVFPINEPFVIKENTIKHSKVGIQTDFMWAEIRDNVIEDMNNNFTLPPQCLPFPPPGVNCPQTPAYGIRALNSTVEIVGNEISNDLSQYSGTMPNTQEKVVGIDIENTMSAPPPGVIMIGTPKVNCNKTEKTGIGVRFAGYNGQVELFNNRLDSNKYGIATDNDAYVGGIGTTVNYPNFTIENADNNFSGNFVSLGGSHTYNFSNYDPNYNPANGGFPQPPKYWKSSSSNLTITSSDAAQNFLPIKDTVTSNPNSISCTAPQLVRYDDGKGKDAVYRNKSGRGNQTPQWNRKGNSSDSALYLRQQLQFYHLSKDSARYNSQQFSSFRDSMKNTVLGRALGKNSSSIQMSRSSLNNFDQNVITVEPLLNKHFSDSALTKSELDQLRQIAVLCPYTDGIAVYQARRVLHEYGDPLFVNDCEISKQKINRGKSKARIKAVDSTAFNLKLYPNPANDQLFVDFTSEQEGNYRLEISDVIGKKVKVLSVKPNAQNQINVSEMQSGVYFVRLLKDGSLVQTEKIVIQ